MGHMSGHLPTRQTTFSTTPHGKPLTGDHRIPNHLTRTNHHPNRTSGPNR